LSVKIEEKGQQKCNKEIQIEKKSKEHKKIGRAHNKTGEKSTRKRKKKLEELDGVLS